MFFKTSFFCLFLERFFLGLVNKTFILFFILLLTATVIDSASVLLK